MALSTNTPPSVSGPILVSLTEGAGLALVSPNINTIDSDLVDLVRLESVPAVLPAGITWDPQFGTFVIDPSDPAFDSLGAGHTTTIVVNFNVTDGTASVPHSMILTVTGVNDAALISGNTTGVVTEDGQSSAVGALVVSDVDNGEATFQAGITAGNYGVLTIAADGAWVYQVDNALLGTLDAGQSATDLITVFSADGTAQSIEITVNGANETVLNGTSGNNFLSGTALAETINGLGGRDSLVGNAGNDSLDGGAGADRLTGGAGTDLLIGGSGADRFIFTSTTESPTGAGDHISDFQHGSDVIDLKAIDAIKGGSNNAFAFVGGAAFTKAGQLRYDVGAGVIEAEVTGDGVADFQISVTTGTVITASDFIL